MQVARIHKPRYGFKNILTGSDLSTRRLAVMEIGSGKPGPEVWITAAIHGDEVGGIAVVHEIFKQLRAHPLKRGSLKALPLMNPAGFETNTRGLPLSEEDLNRSFPGDPHGRLSERIAAKIFNTIVSSKPEVVIDLHNDWRKSVPYLLLDPFRTREYKETYDKTLAIAKATDFIIIEEDMSDEDDLEKTLSGSLMKAGIPSFTLELGESYVINEKNVQSGVAAIWNVLCSLGMTDSIPSLSVDIYYPEGSRGVVLSYSDRPHAQSSGLLRFLAQPGELVKPGQPVTRIYNVFGKLDETVRAEQFGVLLGYTDSATAYPGMPLIALGVLK